MVTGTAIPFATDKATPCHLFKTPFRNTAPVFTCARKHPVLRKSGLLEYHHLSLTGWARDLDESLGVVRDGVKANGHGCTD